MSTNTEETESELERLAKLGKAKPGSGHDCALKGISVHMDINAPLYWWKQFQRYHFADIVSSQSTMHRIHKFDIKKQCNQYVTNDISNLVEQYKSEYNNKPTKDNYMKLIANTPSGFHLKARVTTNYLQLKSIYNQRKNHKLPEWKTFCNWTKTLPYNNIFTNNK